MKMIEIKCNRKVVVRINEIIKVLSVALFIASSSPLHSLQMIQEKHRLASNNEARDRLSSGLLQLGSSCLSPPPQIHTGSASEAHRKRE